MLSLNEVEKLVWWNEQVKSRSVVIDESSTSESGNGPTHERVPSLKQSLVESTPEGAAGGFSPFKSVATIATRLHLFSFMLSRASKLTLY